MLNLWSRVIFFHFGGDISRSMHELRGGLLLCCGRDHVRRLCCVDLCICDRRLDVFILLGGYLLGFDGLFGVFQL